MLSCKMLLKLTKVRCRRHGALPAQLRRNELRHHRDGSPLPAVRSGIYCSKEIIYIITEIRCQFPKHFMRSFWACRSHKCKKTVKSSVSIFVLLGPACTKIACETLVKLTKRRIREFVWKFFCEAFFSFFTTFSSLFLCLIE